MNRIAAVVIACLGVTTAFLFYLRISERDPIASSPGEAEIIARLDRLERSIAQLATARAGAPPATHSEAVAAPAASGRVESNDERVAVARESAIRDGNAIVDRARKSHSKATLKRLPRRYSAISRRLNQRSQIGFTQKILGNLAMHLR